MKAGPNARRSTRPLAVSMISVASVGSTIKGTGSEPLSCFHTVAFLITRACASLENLLQSSRVSRYVSFMWVNQPVKHTVEEASRRGGLCDPLADERDEVPPCIVVRQHPGGNDQALTAVAPQDDQTGLFRDIAEGAP